MLEITHEVAGDMTTINVVETEDDLAEFRSWATSQSILAVDTETTGLDLFSDTFRVRTVQFGTPTVAYVVPVELGPEFAQAAGWALGVLSKVIFHNAAYDVIALQQGMAITVPWSKITDTKILAHLVDPRQLPEGGTGHSLSDLTRAWVDAQVADEVKDSMKHLASETGLTKGELFAQIDLWNLDYLKYAGMDVILTARLYKALYSKVPTSARGLIEREHQLAEVCVEMETNGFLLDSEYAEAFSAELEADQEKFEAIALELGVEKVNSTDQVATALLERGVKIPERTPSGKYKVDKALLEDLVAKGDELAIAVSEAKRAKKWKTTWVQKFIDNQDSAGRCHASIHPLQARTARMSITGIPAQTLPSGDWKVRRCFVAEEGHTIISVDYQAQELRVLAALAKDRNMMEAFATGADLHQMTADASGVDRSVGKTVNFAYVYGSGPANIAKTCGISVEKARQVIKGFEDTYPGVKRLSTRLQDEARRKGRIVTPSGRVIPVDKDRPYAALNYMIQSTSRDITAAALLRIKDAGLSQYLRLPIHDEIVACVPTQFAESAANRYAELMKTTFNGVLIDTDAEIYGPSWGHGYMPDELKEAA